MINYPRIPMALAIVGTVLALTLFSVEALAETREDQQLDFRVFLEANEIGYHRVALRNSQQAVDVTVEAAFDVKVLFFNAFSYRHRAVERWNGDCLEIVETQTDYDGEPLFVRSEFTDEGLRIVNPERTVTLPGCIRSYAYWDLERLRASRLLNTQTGEYQPVIITEMGVKPMTVGDFSLSAMSYQLQTEEGTISLWYGDDHRWLGLQTEVAGKRKLSYVNEALNVDA